MKHQPLLSIIIISHNQKEDLRRCIDSVLRQRTSFPVEVIVSDDRSSDGTRDMLEVEYAGNVISTYCDTDEFRTHYTFERAGYNRINGLKKATGKYIIHIDGDDFFEGDSIFQKQVDILENNPDCSLCVQNYKIAPSNDIKQGEIVIDNALFNQNPIVTAKEFILRIGYIPNSSCCMRRSYLEKSLSIKLDGKSYDDVDITFRYLGDGKVGLLNCADFVYVQNPTSFSHTTKSNDWSIIATSGLQGIRYLPHLSMTIIEKYYNCIWSLAKMAWKQVKVTDSLIEFFKNDDMFIYRVFDNKYGIKNWLRVNAIILWLIPIRFWGWKSTFSWRVLYKLAIR
ncbi:MAG: glycosyltransferase family 2 protein [Paludibacteraceae bacterium]|nr:glycosyltransferase family 2 protein [Paludibacteraceae bacterium]